MPSRLRCSSWCQTNLRNLDKSTQTVCNRNPVLVQGVVALELVVMVELELEGAQALVLELAQGLELEGLELAQALELELVGQAPELAQAHSLDALSWMARSLFGFWCIHYRNFLPCSTSVPPSEHTQHCAWSLHLWK